MQRTLHPPSRDAIYSADIWLFGNRWGPQFEKATYKNRQRLYLSEQASVSASKNIFFHQLRKQMLLMLRFLLSDGYVYFFIGTNCGSCGCAMVSD